MSSFRVFVAAATLGAAVLETTGANAIGPHFGGAGGGVRPSVGPHFGGGGPSVRPPVGPHFGNGGGVRPSVGPHFGGFGRPFGGGIFR